MMSGLTHAMRQDHELAARPVRRAAAIVKTPPYGDGLRPVLTLAAQPA